jgi:hypothetical protein
VEPFLRQPLLGPRQHLQRHSGAIVQHDALQAAEQLAEPALRHACGTHGRIHPDPRSLVHLCQQHQPLLGQGVALRRGRSGRAGRGRLQPGADDGAHQGRRQAAGGNPSPPEPRRLRGAREGGGRAPGTRRVPGIPGGQCGLGGRQLWARARALPAGLNLPHCANAGRRPVLGPRA